MSESSGLASGESRVLPWPGGPRPPGPWGRPPTGPWPPGPWPPGPGPFPQPPDVFSAFAWLAKNYQEAKAAREFLKLLITDLIAEDPTFLANAHATVGVTDGSAAQPGMVGELIYLRHAFPLVAGANPGFQANMGVLPPGDWDCWAYAWFEEQVPAGYFYLNPAPAGFTDNMSVNTSATSAAVLNSYLAVARTSQPSLINFTVGAETTSAHSMDMIFVARRRR